MNLRAIIVTAVIFGMAAVFAPLQYLLIRVGGRTAQLLPWAYHTVMVRLIGLKITVVGTPEAAGPTLFVSNHVSWLDIPILGAVLPASFIAKREVGNMGAFGTLARLQRTVFIDRERRAQTRAQTDEIAARLSEGGNLILFAEGTSTDGSLVLPFKSALFAVAEGRDAALRIQPMTIAYKSIHGLPLTRGTRPIIGWFGDMDLVPHFLAILALGQIGVELRFHAPVDVAAFESRKGLASHCYEAVRGGLLAARRAA
ncbi:lysophospholipid acyltransferase family protein [Govanella unica]|uniref:1-acyl-sn-glycerol-3-phosphate acyltransferase n=1 Tax=Govanella unica TaxID=2975056 RepID=A0A9X3Z7W4_9PROT|nr:lysophospholipid acyltransferase family protein [Govania unica]MDA5194685.1 1-acyl-sn-glycerol-3-phosphate acyltransferase [Govania unica]